jgi:predicted GNAT family N-acyltransferase
MENPEVAGKSAGYSIVHRDPNSLTPDELENVVELLRKGAAVNPQSASAEIPQSVGLVMAMRGDEIVGIGTIKRARPRYASSIQNKSKAAFSKDLPELGYVAVSKEHRNNRISQQIVSCLLQEAPKDLFATTDDERMKRTLRRFGFAQHGKQWKGRRGILTLWLYSASAGSKPSGD